MPSWSSKHLRSCRGTLILTGTYSFIRASLPYAARPNVSDIARVSLGKRREPSTGSPFVNRLCCDHDPRAIDCGSRASPHPRLRGSCVPYVHSRLSMWSNFRNSPRCRNAVGRLAVAPVLSTDGFRVRIGVGAFLLSRSRGKLTRQTRRSTHYEARGRLITARRRN
jgi:hypothetical protein